MHPGTSLIAQQAGTRVACDTLLGLSRRMNRKGVREDWCLMLVCGLGEDDATTFASLAPSRGRRTGQSKLLYQARIPIKYTWVRSALKFLILVDVNPERPKRVVIP
jgi:hypothetical protein